jgi:hypothetical protein
VAIRDGHRLATGADAEAAATTELL